MARGSVWMSGRGVELQAAKARFAVAEGDLVTYINVVKAWEMHKRNRKWWVRCLSTPVRGSSGQLLPAFG
jgi:hypothetical protein